MRRHAWLPVSVAVSVALLLLPGWPAGASHTGLLFGASSRVTITMSEWKYVPATVTINAGESVDFVLKNEGALAHILMVYPAPKAPLKGTADWYAYVLERTYFQDVGEILVHSKNFFVVTGTRVAEVALDAGKTVTLTFTPAKKGRFEMGCHLATGGGGSHYAAGMKGTLIVK